jgi:hypothetical protein
MRTHLVMEESGKTPGRDFIRGEGLAVLSTAAVRLDTGPEDLAMDDTHVWWEDQGHEGHAAGRTCRMMPYIPKKSIGSWVYDPWGHTTPFVLGLVLLARLAWGSLLLRGNPWVGLLTTARPGRYHP